MGSKASRRRLGRAAHYRVRPRQGGEVLRLAGRGRRDLKRLLQEAGSATLAARLLVVWDGDVVAAVFDPLRRTWWPCSGYSRVATESLTVRPSWR